VGDVETHFSLMSGSKPFSYAVAAEQHGAEFMFERVGVSATGLPYNAVRRTSEQNPMANARAIATHSCARRRLFGRCNDPLVSHTGAVVRA
jgi:glutaminase